MKAKSKKEKKSGPLSGNELLAAITSQGQEKAYLIAVDFHQREKYAEARKALEPLAAAGYIKAISMLGCMYEDGQGVPAEFSDTENRVQKAINYYVKAMLLAEDAEALFRLGRLGFNAMVTEFSTGSTAESKATEPKKNEEEILKYFQRAEKQGHVEALFYIGAMYEFAKGLPPEIAHDQKNCQKTAKKYYYNAAKQGCTKAQGRLGGLYLTGQLGLTANIKEGTKLLRKAAQKEDQEAQLHLVALFNVGTPGVTEQEANQWIAALGGKEKVQTLLAQYQPNAPLSFMEAYSTFYAPIQQDPLPVYQKMAKQGIVDTQALLGISYCTGELDGKKIAKDPAKGLEWLHKAADANHAGACLTLYFCHAGFMGDIGVQNDKLKAKKYIIKAALLGNKQAFLMLLHLYSLEDKEAALDLFAAELEELTEAEEAKATQTTAPAEVKTEPKTQEPANATSRPLTTPKTHSEQERAWSKGLNILLVRIARLRPFFEAQKDARALEELNKITNDVDAQFSHLQRCIEGESWPSLETIGIKLVKENGIEKRLQALEAKKKSWEDQAEKAAEAKNNTRKPPSEKPPVATPESKQTLPPQDVEVIAKRLKTALEELQKTLVQSRANKDSDVAIRSEALVDAITETVDAVACFTASNLSNRYRAIGDTQAWPSRNFWWHDNSGHYRKKVDQLEILADSLHQRVKPRLDRAKTSGGKHKKADNYLHGVHPLLDTTLTNLPDESQCEAELKFYLPIIRMHFRENSLLAQKAVSRALGRADTLFGQLQREKPWAYRDKQQRQHQAIRWLGEQRRHPVLERTNQEWLAMLREEQARIMTAFKEDAQEEKFSVAESKSVPSSLPVQSQFERSMFAMIANIPDLPDRFWLHHKEDDKTFQIHVAPADEPHLNKIRDHLTANGLDRAKGDFKKLKVNDDKDNAEGFRDGFRLDISKSSVVASGFFRKGKAGARTSTNADSTPTADASATSSAKA